ncbi:MAG: hypothetical protein M1300_06100 [Epsilonproteobacteria bacterium]|jgi:hypothetical protein|nr:hypothetical protein [Campylobacterota bacterium]
MFESIAGWELGIILILMVISMLMIILGKEAAVVLGPIVLVMTCTLPYIIHSKAVAEIYMLKRFEEGARIECGIWRGESLLVDPSKGWVKNELGFIKEDQIFNDMQRCHAVGEKEPEPSTLPYWILMISLMSIAFIIRRAVGTTMKSDTNEKPMDTPPITGEQQ